MKKQLHAKRFLTVLIIFICASCVRAYVVSTAEKVLVSQENLLPSHIWHQSDFKVHGEKYNEYLCTIPMDIAGELVLGVKGYHTSIWVFLDEEEIYCFEDNYREKGAGWKWIALPEDAAGKRIVVRVQNYSESYNMPQDKNIYLGEKNAIFLKVLQENLYALMWGGVMIILGIAVIIGGYVLNGRLVDSTRRGVHHLGIFMVLAGIWMITDSCILQLFVGRIALITLVSFLTFMAMPYFFLKMFGAMMVHEKKSIRTLRAVYILNLFAGAVMYLFRLLPMYRMIGVLHLLIMVTIVVVLKDMIVEIRKYERPEMKVLAVGMIIFSLCGVAALIFAYLYWNWLYAMIFAIGVLSLAVFFAIAAFERLRYYLFRSASVEEYQRKAFTDSMTRLENRTAFLEYKEGNTWRGEKTCVVMDINNLKTVNDTYGHGEGDKLIVDAAECIMESIGKMGTCYRIGGDEFVAILTTCLEDEIEYGLDILDKQVEKKNAEREIPVKIAYGYSVQNEEMNSFEDWFDEADNNMYLRKQQMKAEEKASLR